MSKLEELIKQHCPNGVEYKTLGELGEFIGGITGKSKNDFKDGNAKFITYMNIYKNREIDLNVTDKVKIGKNENQHTIEYGDICFTGSSETPDECGMSSVLTTKTDEKLYLNSFCFAFRFNDKNLLLPEFSKYLFRSNSLRKQLIKTASGVTRFNVSKEKMKRVSIPLPPLPVQEEIVRILDAFTKLTAELTAELTARRKQYEYYRDALLSFDKVNTPPHLYKYKVKWVTLGEIAEIKRGVRVVKKQLKEQGIIPVYQNSLTPLGYFNEYNCPAENTFIISAGAAGDIGYSYVNFWAADDCLFLTPKHKFVNKYIYYFLQTKQEFIYSRVRRASVPRISRIVFENIQIPLPPLDEQELIVSILDRFDSLCNDLTQGLPAEIEARRKQYEYYRDKLLSFKKAA